MSFLEARADSEDFIPSCPSGGTWYSCGYGSRFVGCCRSEACINDCPAGNLEPASFNTSYYGNFSDQNCASGSWYTCADTSPPFMGCCTTSACNYTSGCPAANLGAGYLSNNPAVAAQFSPTGGPSTTAAVTSSSATSSTTGTAAATSTTAAAKSSTVSTGAVVGAVVGGIAVIAVAIGICLYARRRKKRRGPRKLSSNELQPPPDFSKVDRASELSGDYKHYSPSVRTAPSFSARSHNPSELAADRQIIPPSELTGDSVFPLAELEGSVFASSPAPSHRQSQPRSWRSQSWLDANATAKSKNKEPHPQGSGLGISFSPRSPKSPRSPRSTPLPASPLSPLRQESVREEAEGETTGARASPLVPPLSPRGSSRFREALSPDGQYQQPTRRAPSRPDGQAF